MSLSQTLITAFHLNGSDDNTTEELTLDFTKVKYEVNDKDASDKFDTVH